MSTKKNILDQISKRASRYRKIREKTSRQMDIREDIKNFIDVVDSIHKKVKHECDFYNEYQKEVRCLWGRLRSIDFGAEIVVYLTDCGDWTSTTVDRIVITWSDKYVEKHSCSKTESFDLTDILFDVIYGE